MIFHSDPTRNLWGESYERDSSDVIALEHDLARTIAEKLRLNLTAGDQLRMNSPGKVNPEAYAAYLHGRFYWYKRTIEGFHKAFSITNWLSLRTPTTRPLTQALLMLMRCRRTRLCPELKPQPRKLGNWTKGWPKRTLRSHT